MYINFKKPFYVILLFLFTYGALFTLIKSYDKVVAGDLAKSVIRFHVLANSDSVCDQNLKMKVKESVVNFLDHELKNVSDVEEAASCLQKNTQKITTIASDVIRDNGYDYSVSATLGASDFPEKAYGDVHFPSGTYHSFIIKIGSGKGHNWWCVLYPPLCFVDASTGVLPKTSKETLKDSISSKEYNYVTEKKEEEAPVRFEFKYFTFLNNLFHLQSE